MTRQTVPLYPTSAEFEAHYAALERESLTAENALSWLERWSDLGAMAEEAYSRLMTRYHENTADSAAEVAYNGFVSEVYPHVIEGEQRLKSKLLSLEGYTPPLEYAMIFKRFRGEAAIYREANVPLFSEAQLLGNEYEKLKASRQVRIGEETLSVPMAQKRLYEPDRSVREAAWHGLMGYQMDIAPETDALFEKLLELRRQEAKNADFPDFVAYTWEAMSRFDYTPEQARELQESIRLEVVPLLRELREDRRKTLQLETLRPWDVQPDPLGREPLKPFSSLPELEDGLTRIFTALDPELGAMFVGMRAQGNLELETRPGKVPNYGYNTYFAQSKQSYIYWNATETDTDVRVLLHESGHAFNFLSSMKANLLVWDLTPPIEFAEVASQAMELLALPLLERPVGFYSAQDAARARVDKLETVLRLMVNVAQEDKFQHWLYTQPSVSVFDLDAKWLELSAEFGAGVDWSGLERERAKGWQSGHTVTLPLYMLEYAIAWLGALQLWRNSLENPQKALKQYKFALALGGSRPLPELFEAAGIRFAFDRATVRELMDFVRGQLEGA